MNAQEAITIVEKERDDLSELINKIEDEYSESRLREAREEIEALSIVLESVKVFHQHVIPRMELHYERLGQGFKSVYGVPIEKLGIEEGAEE